MLYVFYHNFFKIEKFKIPTAKDHFENSKYSKILSRTEEYVCKSEKIIVHQPGKKWFLKFHFVIVRRLNQWWWIAKKTPISPYYQHKLVLTKNCSPEFAERALGHCSLLCRGVVILVIYFTSKWPVYQLEGINMSHKGPYSPSYGFSNRELDVKKAERQRIDAFELWCWRRLLRVPWTARRSKQPILKEISPGCSLGRIDVEAETPILWPPDAKSWLIGKDPDAGKDWGQEEKGTTEGEMVRRPYWLNGHEFEQAPRIGEGQGGLQSMG